MFNKTVDHGKNEVINLGQLCNNVLSQYQMEQEKLSYATVKIYSLVVHGLPVRKGAFSRYFDKVVPNVMRVDDTCQTNNKKQMFITCTPTGRYHLLFLGALDLRFLIELIL